MKLFELLGKTQCDTKINIVGEKQKTVDDPYYDGLSCDMKNEDLEHLEVSAIGVSNGKMFIMLED